MYLKERKVSYDSHVCTYRWVWMLLQTIPHTLVILICLYSLLNLVSVFKSFLWRHLAVWQFGGWICAESSLIYYVLSWFFWQYIEVCVHLLFCWVYLYHKFCSYSPRFTGLIFHYFAMYSSCHLECCFS